MTEHKNKNVWNKQHGGSHYQKYVIQPSKFVIRHQDKNGKEDLMKAIHFIEMIIERDYK